MSSLYSLIACVRNGCKTRILSKHFLARIESQNRGMREWKANTLRLMYHRSRMMQAVPHPPRHRSVWQEWKYTSELFAFSRRLHEEWSETSLRTAFTHQSYLDKEDRKRSELGLAEVKLDLAQNTPFSQRGEQLMSSYIKAYLRHSLDRIPEDGVRAIHDYLLSDDVLADIGKWIGCTDLILCEDFPPLNSTLAKTVKALIGALEADRGIKKTENFILDFILTYLADKDLMEIWQIKDASSTLKRILARERLPPAEPRLLRESGRNTLQACYVVGLYVNKQLIGEAPGETLAIAQEMAEYDALRRIFNLTPSSTLFTFGEKGYKIDLTPFRQENLYLNEWCPSLLKHERKSLINMIQ